jgi:hypothetical protein
MRPSIRYLSIGLLGLAIGAYLLYTLVRASARDPRGAAASQVRGEQGALVESSEAGQEEISAIKTDIGRLQYQLMLLRQQSSSNEQKSRGLEAERNSDDAVAKESSEKAKLAYRERMEAFESSFRNEPQDPGWSSSALSAVHEVLDKDEALRAGILHLDCRSSLCRLEFSDNGTDSKSGSIISMASKLLKVFPSMMGDRVDTGGGKTTLVYYMLRRPYSPNSAEQ